jgi:predicted dehydrogenase
MLKAANQSKTVAAIGFTYLRNPAVAAIRKLVASGQLGKVLHFSGRYWCDYSIDANTPISWRYKGGMGSGALADLGSHLIYVSEFITGKSIKAISGANLSTVIKERPVAAGVAFARDKVEITDQRDTVENDDYSAMVANFGDISGSLETSRVAAGHPNSLIFEVFGEKGAAKFSFDHTGEFQLQLNDGNPGSNGYRTVLVGPETPYISGGVALDVPGVGVSVNDQFYFQNRAFLQQVAGLPESAELPYCPNFADGLHNMQVIDTATKSFAANGASVSVEAYEPTFLRKL